MWVCVIVWGGERIPSTHAGGKRSDPGPHQTNNIGYMELNEIRPFVTLAFNEYRRLAAANS